MVSISFFTMAYSTTSSLVLYQIASLIYIKSLLYYPIIGIVSYSRYSGCPVCRLHIVKLHIEIVDFEVQAGPSLTLASRPYLRFSNLFKMSFSVIHSLVCNFNNLKIITSASIRKHIQIVVSKYILIIWDNMYEE